MVIFGTGGGKPGHWEAFEEIFYHPLEYACLPFKNIWDDDMGHTICGFFHGRQYNLKPYYDKDGNSDTVTAMNFIKEEREVWKKSGKEDLYKKKAFENPIPVNLHRYKWGKSGQQPDELYTNVALAKVG